MMRGYASIGLYHPKNVLNVGSALRAAGCYGASFIAVEGRRYQRASTDTSAQYRHTPLLHVDDLRSAIPYDCVAVAVEKTIDGRPLPSYTHPERAFYIFGPEDGSLGLSVLDYCRDIVTIPTLYCMNLAATVNVVLYDRMSKQYGIV
jgi:tRNA(Leu) C34 or U34 (ribose-2'-O)-methylase TrmL